MTRSTILLGSAAVLLFAAPAQATTFSGNCGATGWAVTVKPMGFVPVHGGYEFRGEGHCSGTLDSTPITNIRVRVRVFADDRMQGCASGLSTTTAEVRFRGSGKMLRLRGTNPGPSQIVRGAAGGLGAGYFTIATQIARQPPGAAEACAAGDQIGEGAMDWVVRTIRPLVG